MHSARQGQKRALNTIKLELLMAMSHSVGARNEISPAPCLLFMLFFSSQSSYEKGDVTTASIYYMRISYNKRIRYLSKYYGIG